MLKPVLNDRDIKRGESQMGRTRSVGCHCGGAWAKVYVKALNVEPSLFREEKQTTISKILPKASVCGPASIQGDGKALGVRIPRPWKGHLTSRPKWPLQSDERLDQMVSRTERRTEYF